MQLCSSQRCPYEIEHVILAILALTSWYYQDKTVQGLGLVRMRI